MQSPCKVFTTSGHNCFLNPCAAQKTYYFVCGKWFGLGIEDNLLERTLVATDTDPRGSYAQYRVRHVAM